MLLGTLLKGFISVIGFVAGLPVAAEVTLPQLLGPHGCAIGPSTEAAALEAGFSQTAIDDLRAAPEAVVSEQ